MAAAYLSLGSNEGDRHLTIQQALVCISQSCGRVVLQSSTYETAAWGLENQPDFLNIAVLVETALSPTQLLDVIQQIETDLHRQRHVRWGQRTIDIDILMYNNDIIDTEGLQVPHPMLKLRQFVLVPLAEIAPTLRYPGSVDTIAWLLENCPDRLPVNKVT